MIPELASALISTTGLAAILVSAGVVISALLYRTKSKALQTAKRQRATAFEESNEALRELGDVAGSAPREETVKTEIGTEELKVRQANGWLQELAHDISDSRSRIADSIQDLLAGGHITGDLQDPGSLRPSDEGLARRDPEFRNGIERFLREYREVEAALRTPHLNPDSVLSEAALRNREERITGLRRTTTTYDEFVRTSLGEVSPKLLATLDSASRGSDEGSIRAAIEARRGVLGTPSGRQGNPGVRRRLAQIGRKKRAGA